VGRLGGLDGFFAALESPANHLHIAGVLVFDPSDIEGGVTFEQVRDLVASRLPLVPPFRQRLLEVPFGLHHPMLVDDPDFDIDYHVRRASVPEPGGPAELADLAAHLSSRPLDRSRPLWEFHVVEGVRHGRLALIPKVHHSIIDGVSATDVMAAFFDLAPEPVAPWLRRRSTGGADSGSPVDPSWSPEPVPGEWQRWQEAVRALPAAAQGTVRSAARTMRAARTVAGRTGESAGAAAPTPFDAPRTSINRAISAHRRVAFARLPLDRVQRVRAILGGTTNDVVLAATGGAMRSFFDRRDEVPERSLVAMVPVSVRLDTERGALGNRITAVLVSLADRVADAGERLALISQAMRSAKDRVGTVDPGLLTGWAETLVPAVATRLSRLAGNVRLFDHVAPVCNLVVSNVPGPDVPVYLAGARLVAMYPLGPIVEGVGVNVTVFSYLDTLFVGVQACWDLVPDIEAISSGIERALAELVECADRRDRPVPWWHAELPA
jgi:diacylglycerol O-acyltransferase